MKGTYFEGTFTSRVIKPNMSARYKIFVPECEGEPGLVFSHDGFNVQAAEAMQALCNEGKMPPCVFIGVWPATLEATLEGGFDRWMRMDNYDIFDSAYPRFIVDELIPFVKKEHGFNISPSPDMHLVLGGSSGGISSFNVAWTCPDYFRRVYMSSPSFLAMSNGREMPALIRKCETLPLRVWVEYSENEPDDYFGSSYAAAIDSIRALAFAGYEMDTRYFAGEGHCSRYHSTEAFTEAFEFLWKNWDSEPIKAPRNSKRFEAIFASGSEWTSVDNAKTTDKLCANCAKLGAAYIAEGNKIYFNNNGEKALAATLEREISVIRVSSDGWRLYVGGRDMPCVYAMNIMPDGSLCGRYIHASIHRYTDFAYAGVTDMCVGEHDRIYAATELGVQCIRPFGLIDAIAPLPRRELPESVSLEISGGKKRLVATAGDKAYVRIITEAEGELKENEPKPNSYYD